jgi:ABC-type antimicrobial peptide transport system permease subunit
METSRRPPDPPAVAEIVGVVPDVISNVNTTAPLVKYYSLAQREPAAYRTVVVRAAGDPSAAVRDTMAAIRELDSQVTAAAMLTLDEQIGRQMNPQRFGIYVLGALGGIALLLTVLGTYVLAASMASMRKREMSIRASLGASRAALGGLILGETARLIGAGLIAGLLAAWLGANTIRALLYRIEPLDAVTLAATCGVILGFGLIVSLRPALDAARVDFTRMLREE